MRSIFPSFYLYCFLALAVGFMCSALQANPRMSTAKERFIEQFSTRHDFDREQIRQILAKARHDEKALRRIKNPAEALTWHQYRQIFLTEERIEAGAEFWRQHAEHIETTATRFGVEAPILLAIIGVESNYGQSPGQHRVLDALTTLAFEYPPRGEFFRNELAAYLLLTRRLDLNPTQTYGSYAGAMGIPQFIASSYNTFAIAADGTRQADLFNSVADALASAANYLKEHGWKPGGGIAHRTTAHGDKWRELLAPLNRPVPTAHRPGELASHGVELPANSAEKSQLGLIELHGEESTELWLTENNFHVLTRYNHSALYAMAVFQLAKAIQEEHKR